MFKDLRYYGQFLIIGILTAFESLRPMETSSAMAKANSVPTATGSVNLDAKLSQMKHDIYSQLIGETKTQLKSLDTQLKDSLDGRIKKAVNKHQDSQDRVSQVMSKIKSAIHDSEAHTKSEIGAQIRRAVESEVAKAMASLKESQPEAKSLESCTPAPAPAPAPDTAPTLALAMYENNSKRVGIIEEELANLTKVVMGSLKVMDKILLDWGKQLDEEMETKRNAFEEEWREQIDYTQQALTLQVDSLTQTQSILQQLSMVVSSMRQGTPFEPTDLTGYKDEPPEEVWPGLTDTPAREVQPTHVEEADTSIFNFDSASGSEADAEKDGQRACVPQSLTDWFAGPSPPNPRNDELHVDAAKSKNHHNTDTGPTQITPPSAPAPINDEPYMESATDDGHHDMVSAFKQPSPSVQERYTKVDPEGICLRG